MKTLKFEGNLVLQEEEGGFVPNHIEIDGNSLSKLIVAGLGYSINSSRRHSLPEEYMDLGKVKITIKLLDRD
jgi:hypothetical protein